MNIFMIIIGFLGILYQDLLILDFFQAVNQNWKEKFDEGERTYGIYLFISIFHYSLLIYSINIDFYNYYWTNNFQFFIKCYCC